MKPLRYTCIWLSTGTEQYYAFSTLFSFTNECSQNTVFLSNHSLCQGKRLTQITYLFYFPSHSLTSFFPFSFQFILTFGDAFLFCISLILVGFLTFLALEVFYKLHLHSFFPSLVSGFRCSSRNLKSVVHDSGLKFNVFAQLFFLFFFG